MRCECDLCGGSKPQRKPTKRDVFLACATGLVIGASLALWVPNAHADEQNDFMAVVRNDCEVRATVAREIAVWRDKGASKSDIEDAAIDSAGNPDIRRLMLDVVDGVYRYSTLKPQDVYQAVRAGCVKGSMGIMP